MDWTTPAHGTHDGASSQATEGKREAFKGESFKESRVSSVGKMNEQGDSLDQAR